jgi:hypothetical protein
MPKPTTRALGGVVGAVLIGAGLVLIGLYRISSGTEHHAYSTGPVPPASAHVTAANTYHLSVPGGVKALRKRGVDVKSAECEWSVNGSGSQALAATAEGESTKATNVVASFVAPYTGDIHVDCTGWGAMYIDDADNTPADMSGWFLVSAVIALTIGAGLGLSALRSATDPDAVSGRHTARDDDEIERLVHAVHVRSQDGEIGPDDGDDVLA